VNDKIWKIELIGGATENVTCEVCGVSPDGSLICFNVENGNPSAIKGYAPGQWRSFNRTTLRMN